MRWLILALSLGTTLATLYRGIMPLVFYITNAGAVGMTALWSVIAMLCSAALFGFIGGVLSFNQKKLGAFFLIIAAILTYFGYPASGILSLSFVTIAALSLAILFFTNYYERMRHTRFSRHRTEEDDIDDEDDGEDEENEDEHEGLKSTPLRYKMPTRRSYKVSSDETSVSSPQPASKQKQRKVCMKCGADSPREHSFCYACGSKFDDRALFNQPPAQSQPQPPENKEEQLYEPHEYDEFDEHDEYDEEEQESTYEEREERGGNYRYGGRVAENPAVEVVPVIRRVAAPDIPRNYEPDDVPDEEDVPFKSSNYRPVNKRRTHETDSSYQSFGRYTQSRKKRRVSLWRSVSLVVVGLSVAGALGWFLYAGIRRDVSPTQVEVPQPRVTPTPTPPPPPPTPVPEVVPPVVVEPTLPAISLAEPKRGITIGGVNLRSDHSTTSRQITRLAANTAFEILGQWQTNNPASLPAVDRRLTEKWYQIKAGNNTGWIYGQYAQPLDGRETSLPRGYTDALLNSFGETRTEIEDKLGKPTRVQTRGDVVSLEYAWGRISLRDSKVQSVQLTSKGVSLENNLSVGMTFDETLKLIGAPNRYRDGVQLYLETSTRGIVIRRDNDGNIRSINVGNA